MKYRKFAVLMTAASLILGLAACRAGSGTEPGETTVDTASPETSVSPTVETEAPENTEQTETVPFVPVETESIPIVTGPTVPNEPTDPMEEGETVKDMQVIRTQDVSQSVLEGLIARNPSAGDLSLLQLKDGEALEELLQSIGSEALTKGAEQYGADFFQTYDLIVIPRVTTTGSARHTAETSAQDETYCVTVTVTVPEISTMDMANWFLLIPAPKADTQGRTVIASIAGAPLQGGGNGATQPVSGFVYD